MWSFFKSVFKMVGKILLFLILISFIFSGGTKLIGKWMSVSKDSEVKAVTQELVRAIEKAEGPPTKQGLQQFLKYQEKNGAIKRAKDYEVSYVQTKGTGGFLVFVNYYEFKYFVGVKNYQNAMGKKAIAKDDWYVTSREGQDTIPKVSPTPEPFKFSDSMVTMSPSYTPIATPPTKSGSPTPSPKPSPSISNDYAIWKDNRVIDIFPTKEQAISFASKHQDVMIKLGEQLIWDNIACKLVYQDGSRTVTVKFESYKAAHAYAEDSIEAAKIYEIRTNKLIEDFVNDTSFD